MLKQKFVLSYASQLVIQFLGIATGIVIARVAGPDVMGKLAFGVSYIGMFGFIAQMGLGSAHMKLVSEGYPLDRCLGTYIRMVTATTILFVLVSLGFFLVQKYGYKVSFEGFDTEFCIYATILVTVITSAVGIVQTTFAARIQQAKQDVPNIAVNVISSVAKVAIVLLGFRVMTLAGWSVIHTLLLLAVSLFLFRKQAIGSFDRELALKYAAISAPLLLVVIANSLIHNLDKVLLKFFVSAQEVGYYSAGYRIGGFIQIIAANIGAMFFPLFSSYLAQGRQQELLFKIDQYQRASLIYILPSVAFIMVFSSSIVRILLGSQYAQSALPMSIITLALYIYTVSVPYGNILVAAGKYVQYAVIQMIILAAYVLLLLLFTYPRLLDLRSRGTALALLAMYALSYAVYRLRAGKLVKIRAGWDSLKYILVVLAITGAFLLAHSYTRQKMVFELVLGVAFYAAMYGSLWLLRLIRPDDLLFLKQALSPGQMKKYIASELAETSADS